DALLQAHQLRQHQCARHDGNSAFARADQLGIVAFDGGRDDDGVGAVGIRLAMPDRDVDTECPQPPRRRTFNQIRAGNVIAQRREHFSDAAHPGAADADEMHAFDLVLRAPPCFPSAAVSITAMQASATRSAASRLPTRYALIAMVSASVRESAPRIPTSGASALVNSCWDRTIAAPASSRKRALADCSSAIAPGSGTTIAPNPTAASSATVRAPPRE